MKAKYEKPSVEIISFDIKEEIMDELEDAIALLNDDPTLGGSIYDAPPF